MVEMMAFERIEPFGGRAEMLIGGQIAAVIANVNRDPKQTPEPYGAADFMPWLRPPAEPAAAASRRGEDLTADQLSALLDAELFGKTVH